MGLTAALIPVCVLATFEGGLFMLPAAMSLLMIDGAQRPAPHSAPGS
jgi:hypothetical protein